MDTMIDVFAPMREMLARELGSKKIIVTQKSRTYRIPVKRHVLETKAIVMPDKYWLDRQNYHYIDKPFED